MLKSVLQNARAILMLAAAVFVTASASILLTRDHTEIAAVWIANALIVAALLRTPRHDWPAFIAAAYVANAAANLATGNGWIIAVFCSAANVVEVLICARVLTHLNTPRFEEPRAVDFVRLLIGACIGALGSAAIATIAITFRNDVAPLELFAAWFVSDAIGLVIFVPCFAVLLSGSAVEALRGANSWQRAMAAWAAFALGLAVIFGQSAFDLLPVAPLLIIMIAFLFNAASVALAVAAMSCVAIAATAAGAGPSSMFAGNLTYQLYHLQGLLALLVLAGMPAAIALSQRRRLQQGLADARDEALSARDALTKSEGRLEAIATAARDMIVRYEPDMTMTYVSPACEQVLGYTQAELVGRRTREFLHPDDTARGVREMMAIIEKGPNAPPIRMRLRARHKSGAWIWIEGCPRATFDPKTGEVKALYDVMRDVTEQETLAETLRTARVQAEEAARAKSDFLANMSHELRTPLNSVVGFSHLLVQAEDLSERNRRFATLVEASSRATLSIVNDVLDVSAMERGALSLRVEPVSIHEVMTTVRDILSSTAEVKGVALASDVDPSIAGPYIADSDRLRQVMLNLASNGVKFTDVGSVTMSVTRVRAGDGVETLRFAVRDTGIGIAQENHGRVFERFSYVPGVVGNGTGLGLSIAKSIVELMGGTLRVESALGEGATFSFDVALQRASAPAAQTDRPDASAGPGRRILVVDDVDLNRELVQSMLEPAGYSVEQAGSGEMAIEMCAARAYDLVLMDVRMPGLDGLNATRLIRSSGGPSAGAPILALTAGAMPDQIRACRDAGMNDHLSKPVDQDALLNAVALWTAAEHVNVERTQPSDDLRARFRERLAEDCKTLQMWRDVDALPQEVQPLVHRMAGSAGSFGFVRIGELAGDANDAIERGDPQWRTLLDTLIEALSAELSGSAQPSAA
jgi:PAS domain S-box-containing protein